MIPPSLLSAAARDSVLTALLHLHERGTIDESEVYRRYCQHTRRALLRWCKLIAPWQASSAMFRMSWLYRSHGADTEQTVLWLSWLARQTQKTLRWMEVSGQLLPDGGRWPLADYDFLPLGDRG